MTSELSKRMWRWASQGLRGWWEPVDPNVSWSITKTPAKLPDHTCGKLFPGHTWPVPEVNVGADIRLARLVAAARNKAWCAACVGAEFERLMLYGDSSHDDPRHQFRDSVEWPSCFNIRKFYSHVDAEWSNFGYDDPVPLHPTLHP